MADRVAVMRSGRIEQVDAPDRLYAEPATAFVHEFLGESIRLDCFVAHGRAHVEGLPDCTLRTSCPAGPAIALIRPHEIGLLPGHGPARVESVHAVGPLRRLRIVVAGNVLEVLRPADAWTPGPGQKCGIDLTHARIYASTASNGELGSRFTTVTRSAPRRNADASH
jgi:ABC-type sulfate/molybdate transport systems ATPase subunit